MITAFQQNAFQNNAFQIGIPVPPPTGVDTHDGVGEVSLRKYRELLRKRREREEQRIEEEARERRQLRRSLEQAVKRAPPAVKAQVTELVQEIAEVRRVEKLTEPDFTVFLKRLDQASLNLGAAQRGLLEQTKRLEAAERQASLDEEEEEVMMIVAELL